DVTPDSTAGEILGAMVAEFNEVAVETGLEANAAAVGLTPYEVLVVSSMVQSEVTVERERSLVARVIYNRLDQNIALGIDATLAYELGINGGELTAEALTTDSPYNTRTRVGLPPTPISNPGQPSVVGALNPAPGDFLYYVLQNIEGEHLFTASYDEFLAAKAQCEAAGLGCG
ncbi:MAG: endolytic transglycosylase MltG, partial [Actinomycetota bacterium]|nr:endolytic transglycosylase MltG [Actinomycetota bacterium]